MNESQCHHGIGACETGVLPGDQGAVVRDGNTRQGSLEWRQMGLCTELVNQLVSPQAVPPGSSVFLAGTLCTLWSVGNASFHIFSLKQRDRQRNDIFFAKIHLKSSH